MLAGRAGNFFAASVETCAACRLGASFPPMSAVAMKPRLEAVTPAFVARMQRARYIAWRERVEAFAVGVGARPLLSHLPEESWAEQFAANEDAIGAVVVELQRID